MYNILSWKDDADIHSIAALIRQNKVILGSSDTVLGLLAVANEYGRNALDHVKQRNEKPYLILASSKQYVFNMTGQFKSAHIENAVQKLINLWPGPLTLVLPNKDGKTSAIRVPNHTGLLKLLALTGPLYSTSANISGQPIPERLADVDVAILNAVAAVIDNEGEHHPVVPSTIVDCSGEQIRILREGVIPEDEIFRLLHS